MVLSLVELSILAVRNGIEDGRIRIVREKLPLEIRQFIFNAIAMHSTFDNPNCVDLIARPEFLDGFATLDMKSGKASRTEISPTSELFDRIIPIFAIVKTNGEFFGSSITELRLPVYYSSNFGAEGTTLPTIIRLVAECRNLTKLVLRLTRFVENVTPSFTEEEHRSFEMLVGSRSNLLNVSDLALPWLPVLENLEKLAIFGCMTVVSFESPIIQFKRLSTLHLCSCEVDRLAWQNFLLIVQPTLKTLILTQTETKHWMTNDTGIFPLAMPVLETLTIRDEGQWTGDKMDESVRNMSDCPRLTRVHLDMGVNAVSPLDLRTVPRLARISSLDIDFCLTQRECGIIFDGGPNQVSFASDLSTRIRKMMLICTRDKWNQTHTAALSRMIDSCHNLTTFEFVEQNEEEPSDDDDPIDPQLLAATVVAQLEFEDSKQHLVRLFSDKTRAAKLITLRLEGDFEDSTLNLMSQNCINVKHLFIHHCTRLSDHHLITMAGRGVVLSKLIIGGCSNVRGEGLFRLIVKSGLKMHEFRWNGADSQQQESTEMLLKRNCKYVKRKFKSEPVKQLALRHCFYIGSDCPWDDVGQDF